MMIGENHARCRITVDVTMLVAVMPALFGSKPLHERQIGFPVLYAILPFGWLALEIHHCIDDSPFLEEGPDNLVGRLALEDPTVVHQTKAPQGRLEDNLVPGPMMATVAPGKFVDYAGETTQGLAVLPDHEVHGLFQNGLGGYAGIGTGQVNSAEEEFGERLRQRKADDDKMIGGKVTDTGGELQSACMGHVFNP